MVSPCSIRRPQLKHSVNLRFCDSASEQQVLNLIKVKVAKTFSTCYFIFCRCICAREMLVFKRKSHNIYINTTTYKMLFHSCTEEIYAL